MQKVLLHIKNENVPNEEIESLRISVEEWLNNSQYKVVAIKGDFDVHIVEVGEDGKE